MIKELNKELIIRILKYRRILTQLKNLGFEKVFSNNLGDAIGVAPALVRKDFSLLALGGNKRGGYNIDYLTEALNGILGKSKEQRIIILGMGKIGRALALYKGFQQGECEVAAGFDINPEACCEDLGIPVLPLAELPAFVAREQIEVAVLSVPESVSAESVKLLKDTGIRGILNFTPVELKSTRQCAVQNINIGVEIENLFFQVIKQKMMEERGEIHEDDELQKDSESL